MRVSSFFFGVLLLSLSAFSQSPNTSNQSRNQSVQEQQFQLRRQNFETGRQLLLDKGVPFDPDELLREQWSQDLKAKLDAMPEMHQTRYEKAPLKGAYLADTLYLPEKVQLSGHTLILANYVVFEGKNPVIQGNFDLHFFPTKPVTVLDAALADVLARKPGLQNVKFAGKASLPSFSLIQDVVKSVPHNITFDTSGPEPQALRPFNPHPPAPRQRGSAAKLLPAALIAQACSTGCDLSGASGSTGANGSPGFPGNLGENPGKSPDGTCSASFNGQGGFPGGDGTDGSNGGPGGSGTNGANGGAINGQVIDGDPSVYNFITNGGQGGVGGNGGDGGMGGSGGRGGSGGDGIACGCQLGDGGDAGHGGNGGVGGNGGPGGAGGNGGNGGTISVSLPWNSAGANVQNNAGGGGVGGFGGQGGPGGNLGSAGALGAGASACGSTAPNGSPNFGGSPGKPGNGGAGGGGGSGGTHGPSATITHRPPPGGGGGGDPCLGSGGFQGSPDGEPAPECSPIIIDTEREGFHLTSAPTGVSFDISGTGHPVQIAWTDSHFHNAFLALPGSDGLVHNGKQLFGNFTPQPKSPHPNGFLALAQFDKPENGGNGDGIIDDKDEVFSQLRLWIDENHDGICQLNELHRLPELGVYSLSFSIMQSSRVDEFGNVFRYRGRVNPGERKDPRDETPTGEPGRWEYDVFLTVK